MLTIGEMAKATDTSSETIRYYERIGLMPPSPRTPGGYRLYSSEGVGRLAFIRHARRLEFSLNEIRELLKLRDGKPECDQVRELATRKVEQLETEVARLMSARDEIDKLAAQCVPGCTDEACEFVALLGAPLGSAYTISDFRKRRVSDWP